MIIKKTKNIPSAVYFSLFIFLVLFSFTLTAKEQYANGKKLQSEKETLKVDSLNNLSFKLRGSDPGKAISVGKEALNLAENINYSKGILMSHSFIGVSYRNLSDYSNSLSHYFIALQLADSIKDYEQKAYALINIGNLNFQQGKELQGVGYLNEALSLADSIYDDRIRAYCYINLGRIKYKQNEMTDALNYFDLALDIRKELDDKWGVANTLIEIAYTYLSLDEFNSTIEKYDEALELALSLDGSDNMVGEINTGLGLVYKEMGDIPSSMKYLTKSLEINKKINDKKEIIKVLGALSDNYLNLQDYKNAYEFLRMHDSYEDSIVNVESNRKIANLEINYATREKVKDNELLRKQNEFQEKQLNQQSTILNLFLIIMALTVVLLIVIYSRYSAKQKMNRLLYEKNIEIEKQREELYNLNVTKDKFFSIIAHDLRNPFMNLMTASEFLITDYNKINNADKIMLIKSIKDSANSSYKLLENLLTWAKSQRGQIKYEPMKFDLKELVEENILLFENAAKIKELNMELDIFEPIEVYADRKMINTVIRNLMSNAIKFTSKEGSVKVSASRSYGNVKVRVKDNGMGIEDKVVTQLFNIDSNSSNVGTEGEMGSGLGLLICKEFISMNKGTISAMSEIGKGSEFKFTLPSSE